VDAQYSALIDLVERPRTPLDSLPVEDAHGSSTSLVNCSFLRLIPPSVDSQVGFHEFSHAAAGLCTGAKIKSISLDPNEGGELNFRSRARKSS